MALLLGEGRKMSRKSVGNLEMAMFLHRGSKTAAHAVSSACPSSPLLSRGTDGDTLAGVEALVSKYDNHRPLEVTCASTLGSHRLSLATSYSNFDSLDFPLSTENMLQAGGTFRGSNPDVNQDRMQLQAPPSSFIGRCKYYYDKYRCRNFAPFILLFLYAILGAWVFRTLEFDYEKELIEREKQELEVLRNNTFVKLFRAVNSRTSLDKTLRGRDILLWYEKEVDRLKLPSHMVFDMWGALFYVGALVTTIGYGNIAPRTTLGQSFSVVYAIIGIPLVLAILSQFGRMLTNVVSEWWQKYRMRVKSARSKLWQKAKLSREVPVPQETTETEKKHEERRMSDIPRIRATSIIDVEAGMRNLLSLNENTAELEELEESRTIPIWLALTICIAWIGACAGVFCIWETRWNYFTSLYFFFISLSTIGLGDVVPDHPHMLILMFWMVIIGLSIVSMLLSVIQIKMEEWLYNLMIRMQKEYQRALETGEAVDKSQILEKMMDSQPWFMRNFGPQMINEKQADVLEKTAEQYDRILRETNNKNVQTDGPPLYTVVELSDNQTDSPSSASEVPNQQAKWQSQNFTTCNEEISGDRARSISTEDCSELPNDLPSMVSKCEQTSLVSRKPTIDDDSLPFGTPPMLKKKQSVRSIRFYGEDCETQTDIAQFQIDEILLKLHKIQETNRKAASENQPLETSKCVLELMRCELEEKGTQCDIQPVLMDQSVFTDLASIFSKDSDKKKKKKKMVNFECQAGPDAGKTSEASVWTENDFVKDQGVYTDPSLGMWCRGTQAAQPPLQSVCTSTSFESPDAPPNVGGFKDQTTFTEPSVVTHRSCETTRGSWSEHSASIQCNPSTKERWTSTDHHSFQNRSMETEDTVPIQEDKEIQCEADKQDQSTDFRSVMYSDTKAMQCEVPDFEDRSMATDTPLFRNRSMETELCKPGPSFATQTSFDGKLGSLSYNSNICVDMSTQCTPPVSPPMSSRDSERSLHQLRKKKETGSTESLAGSLEEQKHVTMEVIIQTDDSYLKIARRLDDYRSNNNRDSFLPVCAAAPISPGGEHSRSSPAPDRPSDRRGFYLDISPGAAKGVTTRKNSRRLSKIRALDNDQDDEGTNFSELPSTAKARSTSLPRGGKPLLQRKASLPPGIPRGRVSDYVALHEKGIHSPATGSGRKVTIVRHHSMCE